MKKLFGFIILSVLFSARAYAGIISVPSFSADSSVSHLETFRTTVVNVVNGNIQGSGTTGSTTNVLADSLGELDMSDEINPRVRDSELLSNTVDTTTTQNAYVYSGLTPATSANLTSDISAGTTYVNGYRVNKTATSHTYTASKDTYVDLSQSGAFTYSEVAVGAAAPTVATNSARLAKVTTSGVAITSVTDLANRRLPGLLVPTNFRTGLVVSLDSSTTLTVGGGTCEINNTMVSKSTLTTLAVSTAGDWAGGVSLRAVNTFGFVGLDSSGNLKLHTTAPSNDNYSLTTTVGKKRYASWSSTTYRILGWFYMNGSGSGNVELASNIKEADVSNVVMSNDTNSVSFTGTSFQDIQNLKFYSSGGAVRLVSVISGDASGGGITGWEVIHNRDGSDLADSAIGAGMSANLYPVHMNNAFLDTNVPQSTHTYKTRTRILSSSVVHRGRRYIISEE